MRSHGSATRALLIGLIVWTVLITSGSAGAQEPLPALPDVDEPCAPEVTELRRATLVHAGVTGVWFHPDVARCMLGRLTALPAYVRHVALLDQRLQLSDQRAAQLEEARVLADQIVERSETALTAAMRRAREAEEGRDAWHRSPYLWFVVGVLVAGVLVAVGAYALSAVTL